MANLTPCGKAFRRGQELREEEAEGDEDGDNSQYLKSTGKNAKDELDLYSGSEHFVNDIYRQIKNYSYSLLIFRFFLFVFFIP